MCAHYRKEMPAIDFTPFSETRINVGPPRLHLYPKMDVAAIRVGESGEVTCVDMKWWLIPSWAKEVSYTFPTYNARAETVRTKPTFREPFKRQRCLIPADGWHEWKKHEEGRPKQPYFIHLADDRPFCFAGLWEYWEAKDGTTSITSCTMITTAPNAALATIHHRMPVILQEQDFAQWLDPEEKNLARLEALLRPRDYDGIDATPVN